MAGSTPQITKEEREKAEQMWTGFTVWAKWGVIIVCAVLVMLAFIFII